MWVKFPLSKLSNRKKKSPFYILVRSYREILYIYINCNHNFRTDHKAGAVNIGILEGELDLGDAWEIYSDSHLALVMLIF